MDITHIFGKSIETKISMINYLFNKQNWITTDELAKETGNERKTILKYLSELEEAAKIFGESGFQLLSSKGRGVYLSAKSVNEINKFIFWMTDDSLFSKLFKSFFFETAINLTKWSYENFVSESTARRKISEMKVLLKKFDIQIISKKGIYFVKGDEKQIRYIYYYLFWNIYKGREWPFFNIPEEKVTLLLQEILNEYSLNLPYQIEKQLTYIFAINITRYFQNNSIHLTDEWNSYKEINRKIFHEFEIKTIIQKYFYISNNEINFLLIYLQTRYSFYSSVYGMKEALDIHKQLKTDVYQAYISFVSLFENEFKYSINSLDTKKKLFIQSNILSIHFKAKLFPKFTKELVNEELFLEQHFPNLIKRMNIFCNKLYAESKNSIFLETKYLTNRYLQLFSFFDSMNTFEKNIGIYFETDFPALPSRMLKDQISSLFSNFFNITIYTMEDLDQLTKYMPNVDLVISTNETLGLETDFHSLPIIYLKNGTSKYDIENIYRQLKMIANNQ